MSEAKKRLGEEGIPAVISGHGLSKDNRHRHAFYLPWDSNQDGRIDRLILHFPDGMKPDTRRIAERLKRLWSHDEGEWQLVLEYIGYSGSNAPLLATSEEWESVTPYLHPWHTKRGFDIEAQLKRECVARGLPEPSVMTRLAAIKVGLQLREPLRFHRFRKKRDLEQPDRQGSFWRIRFAEPAAGPIALGSGCHFGLGLFRSVAN
jgi:CRISPR-associated protein Csb2